MAGRLRQDLKTKWSGELKMNTSRKFMGRAINPRVELASGEYDRRKLANPMVQMPIAPVARLFGIPTAKLANYRANYLSRRER